MGIKAGGINLCKKSGDDGIRFFKRDLVCDIKKK